MIMISSVNLNYLTQHLNKRNSNFCIHIKLMTTQYKYQMVYQIVILSTQFTTTALYSNSFNQNSFPVILANFLNQQYIKFFLITTNNCNKCINLEIICSVTFYYLYISTTSCGFCFSSFFSSNFFLPTYNILVIASFSLAICSQSILLYISLWQSPPPRFNLYMSFYQQFFTSLL